MWIARDKSGRLNAFTYSPSKIETEGIFVCDDVFEEDGNTVMVLLPFDFPEVTWENSPVEVANLPAVIPERPLIYTPCDQCMYFAPEYNQCTRFQDMEKKPCMYFVRATHNITTADPSGVCANNAKDTEI